MILNLFQKKILLVLMLITQCLFSQKNEMAIDYKSDFYKAVQLYNSQLYAGAQSLFKNVAKYADSNSNLRSKADYYAAMCSLKLIKTNAQGDIVNFVKANPFSTRHNKAYYNLGNYYYSNRKASKALTWFSKVNEEELSEFERNEMNFKMGYMMLINNYLADAKEKFSSLLGNSNFGNDARYYFGYISYRQKNFDEANDNFTQLANNDAYKSEANYYLLEMAFKNGDFEKAITIGQKVLKKPKKGQKSDIVKIIGESYFNLGKYEEAIPYLLQFKSENGKWNNTNLYYVGYCYYKKGDFKNALKYFTKIIDGKNTIAQNAYYHLGICYMKLNQKTEALNAFKNASDMTFNTVVAEDAALQYTKLSYEQGNPYKTVPETLKEYLKRYPNSKSVEEIKDLLIISYIHENDFESALPYLKSDGGSVTSQMYTEVSLYRGLQLFQERKYRKAILSLTDASNSRDDDNISNKGKYWRAECFYLIGKFNNSLQDLLSVDKGSGISELKNINYNIGYSYFKLNSYKKATIYFKKYIESTANDVEIKNDAINRLGDSFYAIKNYKKAIVNYNIIINSGGAGADYALYQRAMCKGLIRDKDGKLSDLEELCQTYDKSVYKDDALYQMAVTNSLLKREEKSKEYYKRIITEHPNSSYTPAVLLRRGLQEFGENDYDKALITFKSVVAKFPNSEEAKQAVNNVRNVYIDKGNIEPYVAWVNTLPNVNISKRQIDDSSFIAAEKLFFKDDFMTATNVFKAYLRKFPKGAHLLKANYYLGESHYNLDQKRKAIEYYSFISKQEKNEFTEDVTAKLSQVYFDLDEWDNAIPILEILEKQANLDHNVIFAKSNLMKVYYEKKNYDKAKEYADKVLAVSGLDQTVIEDAKLILARIAIIQKDYSTARDYYDILDETATNEVKAESLYYKALFLYEDKSYKLSNDEIQKLIEGYSNYKYWGVKSYIVMAKNHFALGDSYQAVYILESVLKNFSEFKDLIEEARNELRKVKNEESKQNESVKSKMTGE